MTVNVESQSSEVAESTNTEAEVIPQIHKLEAAVVSDTESGSADDAPSNSTEIASAVLADILLSVESSDSGEQVTTHTPNTDTGDRDDYDHNVQTATSAKIAPIVTPRLEEIMADS